MPEIVNGITVPTEDDPVDLPANLHAFAEDVGPAAAAAGAAAATDIAVAPVDAQMATVAANPASEFRSELTATITDIVSAAGMGIASPGAGVDAGPVLQAAFDASRVVHLKSNDTYLIETPIFLDDSENDARYVLFGNGARIVLSNDLPSPTTWDASIGVAPPTAFFVGTVREAWNSETGHVDTSHTGGASNSPAGQRLTIRDAQLISGTTAACLAFGGTATNDINGAASAIINCSLRGFLVGLSWSGYADGNHIENVEVSGNPVGNATRLIYQRSSGDQTRIVGTKCYGAVHASLGSCQGFVIQQPVGGQIQVVASTGEITAGHQETDEISSTLPWSVQIDRSQVTILDHYSHRSNDPSYPTIKVHDTLATPSYVASHVVIKGWRQTVRYVASQGDANKGYDLYIPALNPGGTIRVENSRCLVVRSGVSVGYEGLRVGSDDVAIQAALNAGADYIATGNWVLRYDNGWRVGAVGDADPAPRALQTPSLAVAAETFVTGGSLVGDTTYEYVAAVKTAAGAYSPLSSAVQAVATSTGAVRLTLSNPTGAAVIALWRKAAAGVTGAPDRYIEIPLDAPNTIWCDTGARINGRPWRTSSLPVPDTVKNTGPQVIFPSRGVVGADVKAAAPVMTAENYTSTSYGDCTTPGPSVAATVPASGRVLVIIGAGVTNNSAGNVGLVGVALSGANTVAADDDYSLAIAAGTAGTSAASSTFALTGLTPGLTTFTMKYRVTAGTGTFRRRRMQVIPLP